MTVSYQGREFPICCTGCRDEFLESPEKYIKKASLVKQADDNGKPAKTAPTRRPERANDPFAGDVVEPSAQPDKAKSKSMDKPSAEAKAKKAKDEKADADSADEAAAPNPSPREPPPIARRACS